MARQDLNDMFAQTAFLYGGNAAYLDDLYARYQQNPASVDDEWRGFFSGLKDDSNLIVKNARGASWATPAPSSRAARVRPPTRSPPWRRRASASRRRPPGSARR